MSEPTIPEHRAAEIGDFADEPEWIVHSRLGHSADHDRLGRIPATQCFEPLVHSIEAHCPEIITVILEFGIGMSAKCHAGDTKPGLLDALGDDNGKSTFSGDQSDWR